MGWSVSCHAAGLFGFPVRNIALALLLTLLPAQAVTLSEAVEAAIARAPDAAPILADRATQQARRDAAGRLFPGAPYVQADAATDRLTSRRGFNSFAAELGTPLWLPGEGRAAGRQAGAGIVEAEARLAELRLAAAGLVRDAVAMLDDVALALPPQQRRSAAARQLAALTDQRAARGESPASDALLARSEALQAEAAVLDQQSQRAQAMARYTGITGLAAAPSLAGENPPPPGPVANHPRLLAALRGVEAARAGLEFTRASQRDAPVLALQGRQEQSLAREGYDSRLGVVFRLPLATDSRNAPRIAAAQAELSRAEARLTALARELDIEARQARLALDGAATQRRLADAAFRALDTRRGQIERAYAAGEIPLAELVRARVAAFDADAQRARALAAQYRSAARLNQALGVMP